MRILVCSGMGLDDAKRVSEALNSINKSARVSCVMFLYGDGAGDIAYEWAEGSGYDCYTSSSPERLFEIGKPDLIVIFHRNIVTADMVRRAKAAGVKVMEVEDATQD